MEGKRLIRQLTLTNFLSYGSEGASIELQPLNVLIGPNASGKSNLIEALAVLRAASTDLPAVFRAGGGIAEYIWNGAGPRAVASIAAVMEEREGFSIIGPMPLEYRLHFAEVAHRLQVVREEILQDGYQVDNSFQVQPRIFYRFDDDKAEIQQRTVDEDGATEDSIVREIRRQDLALNQSVLSQRKDPELYPELTYLSTQFWRIALFREWTIGHRAGVRAAQPTDLPTDFLLPDASNLVLVLHEMMQRTETEELLTDYLRQFYHSAHRIRTGLQGGTLQLYIEEENGKRIPAQRLSDGTLRYLSLLAILCHPTPPPLVCIEEPELGLHPDIVPTIAKLLREASERSQIVVTTHSDTLVSALSEVPETIVVCESGINGTTLQRLDRETMASWLEKHSLGEVWRMGAIGGNRW